MPRNIKPEKRRIEDSRPEDNRVEDDRELHPLGEGKNVLTAPERKGYRRRYMNDESDRIHLARKMGYEIVEENLQVGDADVTPRNTAMGLRTEATVFRDGTKAILMEIPEELAVRYDKLKASKVDESEQAIKNKPQEEGHYGNIKISN